MNVMLRFYLLKELAINRNIFLITLMQYNVNEIVPEIGLKNLQKKILLTSTKDQFLETDFL